MDRDPGVRRARTLFALSAVLLALGLLYGARLRGGAAGPLSSALPPPIGGAPPQDASAERAAAPQPDGRLPLRIPPSVVAAEAPAPAAPPLVRVRVTDPAGRGLAGAEVRVAVPGSWGSFRDLRTARTDSAGEALFVGYGPGPLWAEVDPPSLPGGRVAPGRVTGTLTAEAPLELTLVCPGAGALEGRVLGGYAEQPRRGRVLALHSDSAWPSREVDVDGAGHFRIEGLPEGLWRVWLRPVDRRSFRGLCLPPAIEVRVGAGEVARCEIAPAEAGAAIRGRVVDQDARGVPGVLVRAGRPEVVRGEEFPSLAGDGLAFDVTDDTGAYSLGNLAEGRYVVQVGERHASDGVTRDAALFTRWPEPFFASGGAGVDHVTEVERVRDTVAWRVTLRAPELGGQALHANIGWCRLQADASGALCFVTARTEAPFTLVVQGAGREWRKELTPPPEGAVAERVIDLNSQ